MEKKKFEHIPSEKFAFVQLNERLHDVEHKTKPIGYFMDAWIRFRKNKASVVAAVIILLVVIFAILGPLVGNYKMDDVDGKYAKVRPKNDLLSAPGFWDGGRTLKMNNKYLVYITAIGMGAADGDASGVTWEEGTQNEFYPIISEGDIYTNEGVEYRDNRVDSYYTIGFSYLQMTKDKYDDIMAWQEETGIQVIYPMVDINSEWCDINNRDDANFWYRHGGNLWPVDENGRQMRELDQIEEHGLVDNYLRDADGNVQYYQQRDLNMRSVRVLYYNYFLYMNGHSPSHLLGSDGQGYDILVRICYGIRLSLILSVCVFAINFSIGATYGAIEGYYGGAADLIMERISDVINGLPFIVTATLIQLHFVNTGKMSTFSGLLFAFVLTGWLGTAYSVRTQFYRFKNQEYILAARTLGAKDMRLMFKHIFPNAIGTVITSSALSIPGVILSEATLSYLGIVNFNSKDLTSLGTMLDNGQGYLATDPHILMFPAAVISLLMISFNLFGNGLRDAFNPSLRGTEE
ncbi:MAG: ABC transporter permease [Clostridiaceae bacterium]|nr:ABC transporter permease [Eubacteriales bacterium]